MAGTTNAFGDKQLKVGCMHVLGCCIPCAIDASQFLFFLLSQASLGLLRALDHHPVMPALQPPAA
jgi:hypothetical protein